MQNSQNHYVLLFGGNQGEVLTAFDGALLVLAQSGLEIVAKSSVFKTPAWGMAGDDFLNMAVEVRCSLSPDKLLHTVLEIEKQFGRRRNSGMGYQSRQLDIDIIHSYELVYQSNELSIPHPRLHLRKFALVPVKEISPDWVHPVLKKTCMELLSECGDDSKIEKLN